MLVRHFLRGRIVLVLLALPLAYLLLWPVPISPVAWNAPQNPGLVGPFAPNDKLAAAKLFDLGAYQGPEDIALGPDSWLYSVRRHPAPN